MDCVLVVFTLNIQSSYQNDTEAEADEETFDTVQFFIAPQTAWRIRTFSVDEDVHVYSLGDAGPDTLETVTTSTQRTYGDVIADKTIFSSTGGLEGIRKALEEHDWSPTLKESKQHGFAFWVPEGSDYRTRSTPQA
ncbi:MAG: hypothetical protein ACJ8OJ_19550 [Povalibacter sp.]